MQNTNNNQDFIMWRIVRSVRGFTPLEKATDLKRQPSPLGTCLVRKRNSLTGFTLMEILVVLVILSILATYVIDQYVVAREKFLDKETQTNLLLIQAAEKEFLINTGEFITCADTADCNLALSLKIPTNGGWNYNVSLAACIDSTRINHSRRDWHLQLINNTVGIPLPCDCSGANC